MEKGDRKEVVASGDRNDDDASNGEDTDDKEAEDHHNHDASNREDTDDDPNVDEEVDLHDIQDQGEVHLCDIPVQEAGGPVQAEWKCHH